MIVLCDMQGGIRNICVSLLKRYVMKKYRIVSDTRTNYKGKIFEFLENALISLGSLQYHKMPYHTPIFRTCPTYHMKAAFSGNKKRKNACKVALCS